ncbi:HAD-IA family hydrolase [Fibrobacterales bacterium]|nr:HAD-IA family hydrolase [Fibrobacterales bacterium]
MKYKLIIFDFDGTLADSFEFFLDRINSVAIKHRFKTLSDEDKTYVKNKSARELIKFLKIPFWKIPRVAKSMKGILTSNLNAVKKFDMIPFVLDELHQKGIQLALLTSNDLENVKHILGPQFDYFGKSTFSVSILGKHRKFKQLIKSYQLRPEDVLLVGDEVRDIEAAKRIGIDIASVSWGYNSRKILSAQNPTYLLDTPSQILELLD